MRLRIAPVTASLVSIVPLVWGARASSDGTDTTPKTSCPHSTVAAQPNNPGHDSTSIWNGCSLACNLYQPWALPFGITRYLPGAAVHAAAEATTPKPVVPLEAAYRVSLLQPILSYMLEAAPGGAPALTQSTLQALEAAAVAGFTNGDDLTQVATLSWALAWAGHEPGEHYMALLQAAASGSLPAASSQRLGAAHRAILLWCALMHGAVPKSVWESGLRAIAAAAAGTVSASGAKGLDECALLYLLHAALLYGADAAQPGSRTVAAGLGSAVSPTSPAAASAASPACQPRATREEVVAAAAPLGRKGLEKLVSAYGEYVPLHPAIEGPYMALLYVLEQLVVAPSAAGGGGGGGGRGRPFRGCPEGSAAAAEAPWVPPGASEQAAAVLSNPKELARIKRDLLYHWRGDQLVDEVQQVRNQMVYLLTRRMGLTVAQPDDADVAVPSRWLVIYVRSSRAGGASGKRGSEGDATAAPGEALGTLLKDLEAASGESLELLLRDRFAPHVRMPAGPATAATAAATARSTGRDSSVLHQEQQQQQQQQLLQERGSLFQGSAAAAAAGSVGMWMARVRQLHRLGWRVAVVDVEVWRSMPSDAEREAYLLRLLRGRG